MVTMRALRSMMTVVVDGNEAVGRRGRQRRWPQQAGQTGAAEGNEGRDRGKGRAKEDEAVTHGRLRRD